MFSQANNSEPERALYRINNVHRYIRGAFTANENRFVGVLVEHAVCVWDAFTGATLHKYQLGSFGIASLTVSPSDCIVITQSAGKPFLCWHLGDAEIMSLDVGDGLCSNAQFTVRVGHLGERFFFLRQKHETTWEMLSMVLRCP